MNRFVKAYSNECNLSNNWAVSLFIISTPPLINILVIN